ncbi:ABC transporter permease, partial [Candidatus Woesebacteria bacterium]|nr:ABC transporter permease [Candidatus Woesebacteria bacterium]
IQNAITDFSRNKIRTLLTSLGILIGVLSVVLIVAFGLGLKKSINEQFESLGSNQLILFPGKVISNGRFTGGGQAVGSIRFDEKDISSLKRIRDLKFVIPALNKGVNVSGNGRTESASLYIAGYEIFESRNLVTTVGKLFTREDSDKRKKVVVLGAVIAEKLFDEPQNAVGKMIKTDKNSFRVVGVLEKKGGGGFGGPDFDTFIYLPYKTGYIFNPDKKFLTVIMVVKPDVPIATAKEEINQTLLKRYKTDDFSIVELSEIQQAVTDIFGVLNIVLVGIAAISLVVGGIGIMNIMYVTVSERTKEVGVRRALGARQNDILAQFLIEAIILSVFGGLLGLLLAAGIVQGIQQFFPAYISAESVFLALGVSSAIGIVFGVFPARRASQLSPIEAIRYE